MPAPVQEGERPWGSQESILLFQEGLGRRMAHQQGTETEGSPRAHSACRGAESWAVRLKWDQLRSSLFWPVVYMLLFFSNKSHFNMMGLVVQLWKSRWILMLPAPLPHFLTSVCMVIVPSVSSFKPVMKILSRTGENRNLWHLLEKLLWIDNKPFNSDGTEWPHLDLQMCFASHTHSVGVLTGMGLQHFKMANLDFYLFWKAQATAAGW